MPKTTIEQMGKFKVFQFSDRLTSDGIAEVMRDNNAKPGNEQDLRAFKTAFAWKKGTLVALAGKFHAGPMHTCFVPVLEDEKVDHLENIYGDRGTWDTEFHFLAK